MGNTRINFAATLLISCVSVLFIHSLSTRQAGRASSRAGKILIRYIAVRVRGTTAFNICLNHFTHRFPSSSLALRRSGCVETPETTNSTAAPQRAFRRGRFRQIAISTNWMKGEPRLTGFPVYLSRRMRNVGDVVIEEVLNKVDGASNRGSVTSMISPLCLSSTSLPTSFPYLIIFFPRIISDRESISLDRESQSSWDQRTMALLDISRLIIDISWLRRDLMFLCEAFSLILDWLKERYGILFHET